MCLVDSPADLATTSPDTQTGHADIACCDAARPPPLDSPPQSSAEAEAPCKPTGGPRAKAAPAAPPRRRGAWPGSPPAPRPRAAGMPRETRGRCGGGTVAGRVLAAAPPAVESPSQRATQREPRGYEPLASLLLPRLRHAAQKATTRQRARETVQRAALTLGPGRAPHCLMQCVCTLLVSKRVTSVHLCGQPRAFPSPSMADSSPLSLTPLVFHNNCN